MKYKLSDSRFASSMSSWFPIIKESLSLYRLICILISLVVVAAGYLRSAIDQQAFDPLLLRYGISALYAGLLAGTFFSEWVKKHTYTLLLFLYGLTITWIFYLNLMNDFSYQYSVGILFFSVVITYSLQSAFHLRIFVLLVGPVTILGILLSGQPTLVKFAYVSILLIVFAGMYIQMANTLSLYGRIRYQSNFLSTIYTQSTDAILIVDPATCSILDANQPALDFFEADRFDILYHDQFNLSEYMKPGLKDQLLTLTDSNLAFTQTSQLKTLKKQWKWVDLAVKPLQVNEQKFFLFRINDISNRKEVEELITRLSAQQLNLAELGHELTKLIELPDVFRSINKALKVVLDYEFSAIFWREEASNSLKPLVKLKEFWKDYPLDEWTLDMGKGIVGAVAESGLPELVNNAHLDERSVFPPNYHIREEHLIVVPIEIAQKVVGVYLVGKRGQTGFNPDEFDLVRLYLNNSISAIKNGILFEEANTKALYATALVEVTHAINSTTDIDELLDLIVDKVMFLTNSTQGALFLIEPNDRVLRIVAYRGLSYNTAKNLTFNIGESIAGWVAETGEPLLIHHVKDHPKFKIMHQIEDMVSMISIPLLSKGEVIGVLGVDRLTGDMPFSEDDFMVAKNFAIHATLAIEKARLFDQIQVSERKYRNLFEETEDIVFTTTPDGHFVDINPAGLQILGFETKEELFIKDLQHDIYVNGQDRSKFLKDITEKGNVTNYEVTLKRKDGTPVVLLESSHVLRNEKGEIEYIQGIMKDVTEQRFLQQQLFSAQKMESIGLLAGGIAHDFNNILSGIMGYSSFLKTELDPDHPNFRKLDAIERGAQRAAELTAQLLTFSKGAQKDQEKININAIVNDTLVIMRRTFDKAITIETKLESQLMDILGDPVQLQQVILNLAVNARDAMPHGGHVTIETRNLKLENSDNTRFANQTPGDYVLIGVEDTGIGMDESTLKRIFEPFYTTKSPGKGTGLGLSMVYGVVNNHSGFIDVKSQPGIGSRFEIYLPVGQDMTSTVKMTSDSPKKSTIEVKNQGKRVLVVDDEASVRELARDMLTHFGFEVDTASDGLEAIEYFERNYQAIDIVILDMIMPRLNGYETFIKLQAINPQVKAILSTGYSENTYIDKFMERGAVGYLQKPYRVRDLVEMIDNSLTPV